MNTLSERITLGFLSQNGIADRRQRNSSMRTRLPTTVAINKHQYLRRDRIRNITPYKLY